MELKYWRTKVGAEVDFIVEKSGQLFPIEVKSNIKSAKLTRSFRNFVGEYKPKQGFILSLDYSDEIMLKKTKINFTQIFRVGRLL